MFINKEKPIITENDVMEIRMMDTSMFYDVWQNSLDEKNRAFVPDEVFETIEDATEVVNQIIESYKNEEGPFVFAVIRKDDNANIGYVQLVKIEKGWEIGYHIAMPYTGKGYATEAVKLFLKYLQENTDIKEVYGVALAANKASRRVLQKCGFELIYEGDGLYQGKNREIIKTIKTF